MLNYFDRFLFLKSIQIYSNYTMRIWRKNPVIQHDIEYCNYIYRYMYMFKLVIGYVLFMF